MEIPGGNCLPLPGKDVQKDCFAVTTPYELLERVAVGTVLKAKQDGIGPSSEVEEWLTEQRMA